MERFVSFSFLVRQNNAGIASYSHIWLKKKKKKEQIKTQFLSSTSRSLNLSKIL